MIAASISWVPVFVNTEPIDKSMNLFSKEPESLKKRGGMSMGPSRHREVEHRRNTNPLLRLEMRLFTQLSTLAVVRGVR